ncbi:TLC domain-containing protein 2 isoform X1 [Anas platyrhynchos]|uniref:TLC domain-containing protein 2 isoform X1 n=1 Tax=Anas platyrhynchos TaxID=8839 RepID=UPI003AF2A5F1
MPHSIGTPCPSFHSNACSRFRLKAAAGSCHTPQGPPFPFLPLPESGSARKDSPSVSVCVEVENPQQHGMGAPATQHPWDRCWLHLPPFFPFPPKQWRCPELAPKQRGHGARRFPVLPGRCRCPGRCWLGLGGAVVELPWVPHGVLRVAHGCRCGVAVDGRFFRRFPLVEPGLGALGAAASFGSAQPLEVAKHLDLVGTQRAQQQRGAAGVLPLPRAARGHGGHAAARGAQLGGRVRRVFPGRLRGHAVQSEISPVLGAALPSLRGDCLLWYRGAAPSVHGLRLRGLAGGDQLHLPPPAADPAHGRPGAHHLLPPHQHRQPGHLRGVSHHHAGLDDALAAPQPAASAPGSLHCGRGGHGNHDAHEHHPLLPPAA